MSIEQRLLMKPNIVLLRKVLSYIDFHPHHWNQDTWISKSEFGIVACLGGLAALLSGHRPTMKLEQVVNPSGELIMIWDAAESALGLSSAVFNQLVDPENNRDVIQVIAQHIAYNAGEVL